MSKETVIPPAPAIKEMIEGNGRTKRPRPESETQVRPNRSGNIVDVSTDIHDTLAPAGDVDEQIALNEASLREIIGTPIETDDVSVHTSHNAPDPGSEAPSHAIISNVKSGAAEPDTFVPVNGNDKSGARPSVNRSGKTSVGTVSYAPSTHTTLTEGGKPSVQTVHTASIEPCKTTVPIPQTATAELSENSGDALNSRDTEPTIPSTDTDPTRRTTKQRKGELDEYREVFLNVPKITDRQPVFVSRTTRDKIDSIVRRLGERKMSVSGFLENLARNHLDMYADDLEQWRKM